MVRVDKDLDIHPEKKIIDTGLYGLQSLSAELYEKLVQV